MPFLLAASYLISRAGNVTADPQATERTAAFIAIGFVILLGGFPLFTWVHPVSRDAPPLTTAFISSIAIGALGFSAFALRQEYDWFNASTTAQDIFRVSGGVTLLFCALTGWAQKSFSRTLSGMVGIGVGVALLMLAGGQALDVQGMALGVATRALSIGLMGFGLALLREAAPSDDFASMRGLGAKYPLAMAALALGGISALGLPGTLGFVSQWVGARAMTSRGDLEIMLLLIVAIASVSVGFIRGIRVLMGDPQPAPESADLIVEAAPASTGRLARYRMAVSNDLRSAILVGAGAFVILALGLFPAGLGALAQVIAANFAFYR
jgi:multicomponent Na+:H+ antiporter subunit D